MDIQFNLIPQMSAAVQKEVAKVVATTTIDVEARAKEEAPVDTGNLRASISHESKDLTGTVTVGADYGLYVEVGTHKRAATPYLRPAVEDAQADFIKGIQAAIDTAAGGA